jgi:hypothetical protein
MRGICSSAGTGQGSGWPWCAGEVWRSADQTLRRPAAVTVLLNLAADLVLLNRFQR